MNNLETLISNYLEFCKTKKRLDKKTLKAYKIDLRQFSEHFHTTEINKISVNLIEDYISTLHNKYKPKTVKRKIASIKALFHHLEYKEIINQSPFNKLQLKFREPIILPKIIPLHTIETLLNTIYEQHIIAPSKYKKRSSLRDIAVIELLFATGMRISELVTIPYKNVDLKNNTILIKGKGAKERLIHICDNQVIASLNEYYSEYNSEILSCGYFFVNNIGKCLSDQSVRK